MTDIRDKLKELIAEAEEKGYCLVTTLVSPSENTLSIETTTDHPVKILSMAITTLQSVLEKMDSKGINHMTLEVLTTMFDELKNEKPSNKEG